MKKINIGEWKKFKVGELFSLCYSAAYHSKDISETEAKDGLLYVTRSKFNNGIKCRVEKKENYKINPAGTISFGAENADFFLQTEPYITGNKMYYIDTRRLSQNTALFVKGVLESTFTDRFSFSDGMIPEHIVDKTILLPATPSGTPDWEYMDAYMSEVMEETENNISMLRKIIGGGRRKVDISGWKEFRVGDFFKAVRGKSRYMQVLEEGSTPVIAAARNNQGVAGYYDVPVEYKNTITISCNGAGCGSTFYHDYPFAITGDAIVLIEKAKLTPSVKMFISAVYDAYFTAHYSYGEKCSADKAMMECIKLPATPDGQPDWNCMESYMRTIMEESARNLAFLTHETA